MDHIFTPIDDNLTDPGDLVSAEAFKTLADNVNYLMDSMPVGTIICILDGLTGVPTPDPTIWQLCDGQEITNENSPIRNQPAPDYENGSQGGRYMRVYDTIGEVGNFGGSNVKNLQHDHGGVTQINPIGTLNVDQSSAISIVRPHQHTIQPDLSIVNFEPASFVVKHYVKIR